jgi:hypothetical protein
VARLACHRAMGRHVPGGVLIADAAGYDRLTGLLLGWLFRSIAADIASQASPGAKVLEVGCGPGYLSIRLARDPWAGRDGHAPDPVAQVHGTALRLVSVTPWRWPWPFAFLQRFELTPA